MENEDQLGMWLEDPKNLSKVQEIKGIKEKTANYLRILAGGQDIAVDRHLFRFLAEAGVPTQNYNEAHRLITETAALLGVEPSVLDHSIWRHMSQRDRAPAKTEVRRDLADQKF